MKRRKNFRSWLATAIASVIAVGTAMAGTMPTAHADETNTTVTTKSKTSHEVVDWDTPTYFSDQNGVIFKSFDIYDVEDGQVLENWQKGREYSKGIYITVYTDDEKPYYVQKYEDIDVWDKEGTFEFNGEEYSYCLVPPSKLRREHRELVEELIVHKLPTTPQRISYFDYSKDGKLKINDLIFLNRKLSATPMNNISNCDSVMYQQMDKETFFGIVDCTLEHNNTELYVYYGDTVPAETTTIGDEATSKGTSTTSTETDIIPWTTGIAKGISGNDVTWFELMSEQNENGKKTYRYPSEKVLNGNSVNTSDFREATDEDIVKCIDWLETPYRIGAELEDFKIVASKEPIMYSWVKCDFKSQIQNEVYQLCPISDIEKFEYIYGDKVCFDNGVTLINTDKAPDYFVWCPGWFVDYHPFRNDRDTVIEHDGYNYDLVIDMTDKMDEIYKLSDDCYICYLPIGDKATYTIGNGFVYPEKVAAK